MAGPGKGDEGTGAGASGSGSSMMDALLADTRLLGVAVSVGVVVVSLILFALVRPAGGGQKAEERATKQETGGGKTAAAAAAAASRPRSADKPYATAAAASVGGGKGKKKKKKSKAAAAAPAAAAPVPAPAAAAAAPAPELQPEEAATRQPTIAAATNGSGSAGGGGKSKKKKNKNKSKQTAAATAAKTAPTAAASAAATAAPPVVDTSADEDYAKKIQQQFNAEAQPDDAKDDDGWAVAMDKKKKKKGGGQKKKQQQQQQQQAAANASTGANANADGANGSAAASATAAAASAVSAEIRQSVVVDAKKIGIVIGPKGATMQAIEAATNTRLEINAPPREDAQPAPAGAKATVIITGTKIEDVRKAKQGVQDLCSKGYTALTEAEGFSENYVSVHPRYLSELVGSGGSTIRAIQTNLDVKVTIPPTDWKPNAPQVGKVKNVKVGVAGSKDACIKAKQCIQQIVRYHYSEVTHPGLVHEEVDIPPEFYHCVIGPRGSEIKHIRGNYQCDVHIPNEDSYSEYTIVVGKKSNVDRAISHIHNLMDRDTEMRQRKYDDETWS